MSVPLPVLMSVPPPVTTPLLIVVLPGPVNVNELPPVLIPPVRSN